MAASKPAPRPSTPNAPSMPDALGAILTGMLDAHQRLLAGVDQHRAALAAADAEAIARAIETQTIALQEIAALESRRAELLGARGRITIRDAASALDEPDRTRLLELAEKLREAISTVRRRQEAVRAATRSLLDHTRGLMSQVASALSHAGTYGRAGAVRPAGPASALLDMST